MGYIFQFESLGTLLAQAEAAPDAGQGSPSPLNFLPGLLAIAVLFYFLMIRPERKRQAAHKSLLDNLKKNDRVVTVGGIYGVVASVQRDADEVTIKVDEATNTKIRITVSSVLRVLADEPTTEKSSSS